MTTETTTVADEIAALRSLTALRRLTICRCDPVWTERNLHAPDCVAEYRDDVDALANQLDAMRPVVEAAREALQTALHLAIDIQGNVAETMSGGSPHFLPIAYGALTHLADGLRSAIAAVDVLDGAS